MPVRRLALPAFVALLLTLAGAFFWSMAGAQEDESEERGRFTRFVEDTISTPDRRIRLGSIDGVLSSDVRIDTITIADREGVWLTIEGAHLVWSRLALLRGRLDIDLLEAQRIVVTRKPLPAESVDPAASPGFALPELPVEVLIDKLAVPEVSVAEGVVGEAARLSVDGAISLAGGALDSNLAIVRTDDRPGRLRLVAGFVGETRQLTLDLALEEEKNGVVSNLLGIPNRPALAFTIAGSGPLSAFAADITLAADGTRLVAGRATISEVQGGYRFVTDVNGTLGPLVPAEYQDYVRGTSRLSIDATRADDGSLSIARTDLVSGVVSLAMSGRFAPDGFPTALAVDGRLADPQGPVTLPGRGKVDGASFDVAFGGAENAWRATFDLAGLDTGRLRAGRAQIVAEGTAENLPTPDQRRLTFTVDGGIESLSSEDPDLAEALGEAFQILARGQWSAGQPVEVEIAEIKNPNAAAHFRGRIDGATLDGRYTLNAADIAPFAGLVGQELRGAVTLAANGTVDAATGGFVLDIDADTVDLALGNPTIDPLLAGKTTLKGGASRSVEGLRFTELRIENPRLTARLDGNYDLDQADLDLSATLADVAVLTDRASGETSFSARIFGTGTSPNVTASVSGPKLKLVGRDLENGLARFEGTIAGSDVDGALTVSGTLDKVALDGAARVETLPDGTRRLDDLRFSAGETTAEGALALLPSGLLDGRLKLASPDIAVVAPLALVDAAGRVDADITLAPAETRQTLAAKASVGNLRFETTTIGTGTLDLSVDDLLGVPLAAGRFEAANIRSGAVLVDAVQGTATREGERTAFDVTADLAAGRLATAGALARAEGGFDLSLDRLDLTREPSLSARLQNPVTVSVRGDRITIPDTALALGEGRAVVRGVVADALDLSATVERLPLALADAFAPGLGLGGTVSGSLTATGPRNDPSAAFSVRGEGITATPLKRAGIAALRIAGEGTYAGGAVRLTAETNVGGGRVRVAGSAGEVLDLDVTVTGLPAALANAASPDLGASGTLDATLDVTGTPAAPVVAFDARGRGLSAAPLRAAGVGALALTAEGRFADNIVRLSSATVTGPNGLTLRASGSAPVRGAGLDLAVDGSVPLSLANPALATRGARLSGTASVDARVTGSVDAPRLGGSVTVDGASLVDPETTNKLTGLSLRLRLDGERAVIERLSARTAGNGSFTATGSIGIAPNSGFPLDLTVAFDRARFTDGDIVVATLSGDLSVSGPATGTVAVGGNVRIDRAEITVPERLPSRATLLDVKHRLPPPNVRRTLERAKLATETRDRGTRNSGVVLSVTIDAPGKVFVRGRGIDAELGGRVTVTGPITAVQPVGELRLIRGRVSVIGQRINFTSGSVTLTGDLDPYIDLQATSTAGSISVTASVTGQASNPQITLTSSPELPQDEILAQFLFGRSLTELSPVQIARLALAAAQLAGGGSGGGDVIDQLRASVGLDDLDVVTDSEGNTAVQAGRYISENVYLGVTAGANGQSNVSVNLDITDNLKARAEVGPTSGSKLGIFYEKEY